MAIKLNKIFVFAWSPRLILLSIFISVLSSALTYERVIEENITELFGLLGLLPFAALGFIIHLISSSANILSGRREYSAREARSFNSTLSRKRAVYIFCAIFSLLMGFLSICMFMFFGVNDIFVFIFMTTVYFSSLAILICIIEESYLAALLQYIESRRSRRLKREQLDLERISASVGTNNHS